MSTPASGYTARAECNPDAGCSLPGMHPQHIWARMHSTFSHIIHTHTHIHHIAKTSLTVSTTLLHLLPSSLRKSSVGSETSRGAFWDVAHLLSAGLTWIQMPASALAPCPGVRRAQAFHCEGDILILHFPRGAPPQHPPRQPSFVLGSRCSHCSLSPLPCNY